MRIVRWLFAPIARWRERRRYTRQRIRINSWLRAQMATMPPIECFPDDPVHLTGAGAAVMANIIKEHCRPLPEGERLVLVSSKLL